MQGLTQFGGKVQQAWVAATNRLPRPQETNAAPCDDSEFSLLRETGTVAPGLVAAYEHCRKIAAHYGKTYYFSTGYFPATVRPAVHALYAWVRYPDEWVDNPNGLSVAEQADKLRQWRDATADAIKTGASDHPVLAAWADSARRYEVPAQLMRDFLGAMEMDLTVSRYATFDDLQKYTYGSASVVGLIMCRVVGCDTPAAMPHASALGLGMQLTNFLRDVGEDYRTRGRIYLPQDDMKRFGVTDDDIRRGVVTEDIVALLKFEIERTREIYAYADAGVCYLPRYAQLPVRLARILYSRILDKIETNGYDVFTKRACVPTWEKLVTLAVEQKRHGK